MANTKKYISLDKLEKYNDLIKGVISAGDEASLKSAKDYADSLAGNYDAAGAATTAAAGVQANLDAEVLRAKAAEEANAAAAKKAQDEVDALELVVAEKAAQADLEALAGKVGEVPADQTVMGIITNIQENAYDDTALKAEINAELAKKADKTQVATDIATAVKVETDARVEAIEAVQGEIDALEKVHADDKKALEDAIALKADITALNEVSAVANAAVKQSDYDTKVAALEAEDTRIEGLVTAEAAKAREEEGKLDARLVEVETFFKTAEGETLNEALDTLVEIQKYVTDEGAAADQMVKDIAANKKAIEDHVATDHDFAGADAALKEELMVEINKKATIETVNGIDGRLTTAEGKITTAEGEIDTLQSEMDAVEALAAANKAAHEANATAIALKASQADLEAVAGRVTTLETWHNNFVEASEEDINALFQ